MAAVRDAVPADGGKQRPFAVMVAVLAFRPRDPAGRK